VDMEINKAQFNKVVAEAKAKAGSNKRWIAAIDKAADALLNGKWIVTELQHCYVFTTESGKTYRANGVCQCDAFFHNQPCKHRSAARLLALYAEAVKAAAPRLTTRRVESDRTGARFEVVRYDNWAI
jgi:hypothetical protein